MAAYKPPWQFAKELEVWYTKLDGKCPKMQEISLCPVGYPKPSMLSFAALDIYLGINLNQTTVFK